MTATQFDRAVDFTQHTVKLHAGLTRCIDILSSLSVTRLAFADAGSLISRFVLLVSTGPRRNHQTCRSRSRKEAQGRQLWSVKS